MKCPPTHWIFGAVKDTGSIYRRTKDQVRRSKTVTNIWKHTILNNALDRT